MKTKPSIFIFIDQLFCFPHDDVWIQNIYGDSINILNGRSIWQCTKCNRIKIKSELHTDGQMPELTTQN